MLMQQRSTKLPSRTSACSVQGFPVSHFLSLANEKALTIPEVLCSLRLPEYFDTKSLHICCLKTYPDCYRMIKGKPSPSSSVRFANWGTASNGLCITARISESLNPAAECSLSDILIQDAPEKYYLSDSQTQKLLYCWSAVSISKYYCSREVICIPNKNSRAGDILLCVLLYIPVAWFALIFAQSIGEGGLPNIIENLTASLNSPFTLHWTDKSSVVLIVCTALYLAGISVYFSNRMKRRDGEEHGSAVWGSARQVNSMFAQKENKPLTRHVKLGLDSKKHQRNLNVLVIGGSGASKTRGYVKPVILEGNTNFVITDPKMEVLTATGSYLKSKGYDIRVLNLVNFEQSDGYNPFRYLQDDKDVLRLVNNLIQSTTPKGAHESDPFWTKSETALLQAIILMLFHEAPEYEQNFSMVMRILEYAEVKEDDEDYVSPLDMLFESLAHEQPEHIAVRQY